MNIGETVPLSLEHEQRVGKLLSHLCFSLLGEYATSIEDDEQLVERRLVEGAVAEAVKFRLSRKRCLKQVIALLDKGSSSTCSGAGRLKEV